MKQEAITERCSIPVTWYVISLFVPPLSKDTAQVPMEQKEEPPTRMSVENVAKN